LSVVPGWLRSCRRAWLGSDLVAGLIIWSVVTPQAVAYAQIAGLPPQAGLVAAPGGLLGYALLGSSRTLVVSATTATAALSAAAVGPLADGDAARFAARDAEVDGDDRHLHAGQGSRLRRPAVGARPQEPAALRGRCRGNRADRCVSGRAGRCARRVRADRDARTRCAGRALLRARRPPEQALDRLKAWMSDNNAAIMAVLGLVIGAKLIGDAISEF
jgi:hypothetical protein